MKTNSKERKKEKLNKNMKKYFFKKGNVYMMKEEK